MRRPKTEPFQGFQGYRHWNRQLYLRQYTEQRRAAAKAAGSRRIDVTLNEEDLAHFERVKRNLDKVNQIAIERGIYNKPKTLTDGRTIMIRPTRLSDTEIIKSALRLAVSAIEDEGL